MYHCVYCKASWFVYVFTVKSFSVSMFTVAPVNELIFLNDLRNKFKAKREAAGMRIEP